MEADSLAPWMLALKVSLYGAALLAAGTGLHVSLAIIEADGKPRALSLARAAALIALTLGAAKLLLVNAQLGGAITRAFDSALFGLTWRMHGPAALALLAGGIAILAATSIRAAWLAGTGSVAIAASFALTGHSQALEPPGVAPWAAGAHVLLAGFWFAAPMTLWPGAHLTNDQLRHRLEAFSRLAIVCVPILFALGLWLAWRLAGGWEMLLFTLYGALVFAKLGLASGALCLGALNKLVISKAVANDPHRGRLMLMRSLSAECTLFIAALALIGWATTMTGPS